MLEVVVPVVLAGALWIALVRAGGSRPTRAGRVAVAAVLAACAAGAVALSLVGDDGDGCGPDGGCGQNPGIPLDIRDLTGAEDPWDAPLR